MFGLGAPELIIILLLAFLLFGSKKLPELGAGIGKAIGSFKKGLSEVEVVKAELATKVPGAQELAKVKKTIDSVKDIPAQLLDK